MLAPTGAEKIIELVGPGMSFGEALLFLDRPSPVTAQAIERSRVAFIPIDLIFNLIEHSSQFTFCLLAGLSQRLRHLVADLEAGGNHDIEPKYHGVHAAPTALERRPGSL